MPIQNLRTSQKFMRHAYLVFRDRTDEISDHKFGISDSIVDLLKLKLTEVDRRQ